jgi:hypothetical protein
LVFPFHRIELHAEEPFGCEVRRARTSLVCEAEAKNVVAEIVDAPVSAHSSVERAVQIDSNPLVGVVRLNAIRRERNALTIPYDR